MWIGRANLIRFSQLVCRRFTHILVKYVNPWIINQLTHFHYISLKKQPEDTKTRWTKKVTPFRLIRSSGNFAAALCIKYRTGYSSRKRNHWHRTCHVRVWALQLFSTQTMGLLFIPWLTPLSVLTGTVYLFIHSLYEF